MASGRRGRVRAALIGGSGAAGPARGDNVGWARGGGGSGPGAGHGRGAARPSGIALLSSGLVSRSEKPRDGRYRHRRLGPRRDFSARKGGSALLMQGKGPGRKERRRAGGASCWVVSAGQINTQRGALTKYQTERAGTNRMQKVVNSRKKGGFAVYSVFTSFGRGAAEMSPAKLWYCVLAHDLQACCVLYIKHKVTF